MTVELLYAANIKVAGASIATGSAGVKSTLTMHPSQMWFGNDGRIGVEYTWGIEASAQTSVNDLEVSKRFQTSGGFQIYP